MKNKFSNFIEDKIKAEFEPIIAGLVNSEKNRPVKAYMIDFLGKTQNAFYKDIYLSNVNDSSYSVASASLDALSFVDSTLAFKWAEKLFNQPANGKLDLSIKKILIQGGKEEVFDKLADTFEELEIENEKFNIAEQMGDFMWKLKSNERMKRGIELIAKMRDDIPILYKSQTDPFFNGYLFGQLLVKLKMAGNQEMVKFLEEKLK